MLEAHRHTLDFTLMPKFHEDIIEFEYREFVRSERGQTPLGQGPPVTPFVNYGRWLWRCEHCGGVQLVPTKGEVACIECEDALWREVNRQEMTTHDSS